MDEKPVAVAFCIECYSIVLREKMTEHWKSLHKTVKATEVKI
jgi:hypothetical protein